jgi:glycosyltransferase involved in cell wall biosynthesis
MDLGGIINHTEQLIGGLKDLGHAVDLKELVYSERTNGQGKSGSFEHNGPSGIAFSQQKGWNFGRTDRIPYKGSANLMSARQLLNGYDLVIWTVPVVPKNKVHLGNADWPALYDLGPNTKQIAFIHDGNARSGSPHLLHIQDHLQGVACVHGCALKGSDFLSVPRALILNPQFMPVREYYPWQDKMSGFVNMQTFKAWKHVHELIESIAYMPRKHPVELREVAGKGIEYQYMTSVDKCKDAYFHGEKFGYRKFWDEALDNGMTHHDYWTTAEVDTWLSKARVLVDPSWSKKYSQVGGHWNRVVVDAMIRGCVPVAQSRGMGDELFVAGEHYVDLGKARDAADYADIILETSHLHASAANHIIGNCQDLLPMFDRKTVAQQVIDLAMGNLPNTYIGQDDKVVRSKMEDLMFDHYGVLA